MDHTKYASESIYLYIRKGSPPSVTYDTCGLSPSYNLSPTMAFQHFPAAPICSTFFPDLDFPGSHLFQGMGGSVSPCFFNHVWATTLL